MEERSWGTRAVPLFPPGCILRDRAAFTSHFCSRVLVRADVFFPRSRLYIASSVLRITVHGGLPLCICYSSLLI